MHQCTVLYNHHNGYLNENMAIKCTWRLYYSTKYFNSLFKVMIEYIESAREWDFRQKETSLYSN